MRYLTTALVSEGSSDDRLLAPLLTRGLHEVCASEFNDAVEISDMLPLRCRVGPPSVDEILDLVHRNSGIFYLVFVHRDQGANSARFDREWRAPLATRWSTTAGEKLVMVVPVRESEAWVLADGDALRRGLGVRWSDRELGVPARTRDVERIDDPKVPLARLGQRIGRPVVDYYGRISELISLDVLRQVDSFKRWRNDVIAALVSLGFQSRKQE